MSFEINSRLREGRAIFVLIPLLVFHLILLSVQIEGPEGTILFREWVLLAGTPLYNVSASIYRGIGETWSNYVWLRGARQENALLTERVRQLTLRDYHMAEVEAENQRLRSLLAIEERTPFETLTARVVERAPAYLANVLYIDRGSSDGVEVDTPVLSGTGVLGRVVIVSRYDSQVQLITNADASLGAMVARSRAPGVLTGTGDVILDFKYINNSEQVNINDLVVTSGLEGIYPKGLPIGRVVESHRGKSVFRVVRVEPGAELIRVEEVLVLLDSKEVP